jgi:hypothetical protein
MANNEWKERLRACFENIEILERCKLETAESFRQFCEFIAEPAFETLAEEMKNYGVRGRFWTQKGKSTRLKLNFPRSKVDNFNYTIFLPRNSVQLELRLQIKGRKTPKSPLEVREERFMEKFSAEKVMKIAKEDLLEDIIEHYRDFTYAALTSAE